MKVVANGIWVVNIADDYSWATVYGRYASVEQANAYGAPAEGDYDEYHTRWLHEGEALPDVPVLYGL